MAVVVRDAKVLVQRRYRRNQGMVYEFPGGAIDYGETPEKAAIRELKEETGLNLENATGRYKYDNEYECHIFFVVLLTSSQHEPTAVDPERRQTFHWLTSAEISNIELHTSDKLFVNTHLKKYI